MKLIKRIKSAFGRIPLKFSIWMCFISFTIIVFVLLWLFQILFLEKFYTVSKIHDVERSALEITASYETDKSSEFSRKLEEIAIENDLCIEIVNRYGRSWYTKEYSVDCVIHGRTNSTYNYQLEIENNLNQPIWRKLQNAHKNYSMMLFGCALGDTENPDGYLFINHPFSCGRVSITLSWQRLLVAALITAL